MCCTRCIYSDLFEDYTIWASMLGTGLAPAARPQVTAQAATLRRRACAHHARRFIECKPPQTACAAATPDAAIGTLNERELQVKLGLAASLGKLDMSDCRLPVLPEGVCELQQLEELSLSGERRVGQPILLCSLDMK